MIMTLKALATAAVLAMPMAASAVTVAPGDQEFSAFSLAPGGTASFSYDSVTPVRVEVIATSGTGFNDGADLATVMFGVNGADTSFTTIVDNSPQTGSTASAIGSLPSFVTSGPFTLDFTSSAGATSNVQLTYSFIVSAVPIPAAGGLLLAALLAGAVAARRKTTSA